MNVIAERTGLQVNYICKNNWAEMVSSIDSGEATLSILMRSEERERKLLFTTPIEISYLSYFTRSQSDLDLAKVPDGYTVGVVKGGMAHEQLKKHTALQLIIYNSYQEGLFGLLSGEITLFAGEESMILKNAKETRLEDRFKKVGKPFLERERCLTAKKDNPQLIGMLNKVLDGFMDSPEYQRIYLRWYGTPEPYWSARRILTFSGIFVFIIVGGMAAWRYMSISRINRDLILNIAERKLIENSLRESEEKYRELVETANSVILTWDTNGNVTFINKYGETFFGFPQDELLGKNVVGTIVPSSESSGRDLVRLMEEIQKMPDNFKDNENENITKDGRRVWVRWANRAILDEHGAIIGILSIGIDITLRKLMEKELHQKDEMMQNLFNSVDEGFVVIDRQYRILTANRAYCNQVGMDTAKVLGKHCFEISHKLDHPCFEDGEECATRMVFETGNSGISVHRHMSPGDELIFVETKAFPLKDSSGEVTAVIEVVNNITDKQLVEEQRLKAQKLEAVGTLAGGIAHDFNNLLQGVFGYITIAKLTVDQKQKCVEMLDQAEKALHMSVNLTNQLLTFAKGGKPVRKTFQMKPLIENSVKFALSGSRIDYKLTIDNALRLIEADEGQIGQVIQNIVLNAEQSMPAGGTIMVKAENVHAPNKGIPSDLPQGDYVQVSVTDNGIGIPEDFLSRIFDPYFTTKERGSGLGLATSYSIIKNHDGTIDVKSELGKGSTFSVWLPAVEAAEMKPESLPLFSPSARTCRVLVMDDEEMVRNIAGEMIGTLGYEVEFAANGNEAIEKYQSSHKKGKPFDILILDLTIRGGLGGIETIDKLRKMYPGIKAIVSSGYSDEASLAEHEKYGFVGVLKKPYTLDGLKAVLSGMI